MGPVINPCGLAKIPVGLGCFSTSVWVVTRPAPPGPAPWHLLPSLPGAERWPKRGPRSSLSVGGTAYKRSGVVRRPWDRPLRQGSGLPGYRLRTWSPLHPGTPSIDRSTYRLTSLPFARCVHLTSTVHPKSKRKEKKETMVYDVLKIRPTSFLLLSTLLADQRKGTERKVRSVDG